MAFVVAVLLLVEYACALAGHYDVWAVAPLAFLRSGEPTCPVRTVVTMTINENRSVYVGEVKWFWAPTGLDRVKFLGDVSFYECTFRGSVTFNEATF